MNTSLLEQLQSLNLSSNEAKVYLALVDWGQTAAGELVRDTGLHRSVVYESLDKLITKKLVNKLSKNNITYFQLTDPQRLLNNIKLQEEIAKDVVRDLQKQMSEYRPEMNIYEGDEECKKYWLQSAVDQPKSSEVLIAGSVGSTWWDYMGRGAKKYLDICKQKKIRIKMLMYRDDEQDVSFASRYPNTSEVRLLEREVPRSGNFTILGYDTVVLQSTSGPQLIEIKNPLLVPVFHSLFSIMWTYPETEIID